MMLNRFRWVFCQLDRLRRCLSPHIRQALYEPPETLDKTYERTLLDISKDNWAYAHRLFQCIVVAHRPLRVEELAEFLAFKSDEGGSLRFEEELRPEDPRDTVLSTCSSLIMVVNVGGSPVMQFSHISVKEYLISTRIAKGPVSRYSIPPELAHLFVTQACLSFLLQLDKRVTKKHIEDSPLARYAGQYWTDHAEFGNVSSHVEDMMRTLFDPQSHHFKNWLWIYDTILNRSSNSPAPCRPGWTPLHLAAQHGFHRIAEWLITTCAQDVNVSYSYRAPLNIASMKGHFMVAQVLLAHHADVDINGTSSYWGPLHLSGYYGHPTVARVLLDHRADVNIRTKSGRTPLLALSERSGNLEIAQMLLEHGADPNARPSTYVGLDSLHLALKRGHSGLAQLLLKHGADPNSRDVDGQTPLHVSSRLGHQKVARELLELDVDINSRDNQGRTPLQVALENGSEGVVRLLLEHRAKSTSPPRGADAKTQVRIPVLNDTGSLYDTTSTSRRKALQRHETTRTSDQNSNNSVCSLTMRRDILRAGGLELRAFRVIHPRNQRNVTRKNWSVVRRRWLGVKAR